jgi:hypothetical protein
MSFTSYTVRRGAARSVLLLIVLNAGLAVACVFAWSLLGVLVADPIAWATWVPLGRSGTPDYFRYPFGLLWMMPAGGALVAWMGLKLDHNRLAWVGSLFPLALLGIVFGWYYLAPVARR